ncbi:MAG: hypothetical protein OEV57_06710 [Dehalococcoidia bacterium]|nr:hypothetical protein [Dehalococcoidia bacterium]
MIKTGLKKFARDQKGQAMILAVVMLLVGGLAVSSLLSYMGTGLVTGEVYEEKVAELYAADAGVEDAIWKIQLGELGLCAGQSYSYNMTDVNGKNVGITITRLNNSTDTVTHSVEATVAGDDSGTRIYAYVYTDNKYGDYAGLLEQILTSPGEIDVANKVILEYPEGADPYPYYPYGWPEVWELEDFYWGQVEDGTHYYSDTAIDILGSNTPLGPLYVDGTLDIKNSSATPAAVNMTGTIYATGDTEIGTIGKDITLDMAGHTLFVSSNTTGNQKALIIGGQCTVRGPGTIVVVGDIEFKPKSQVGEEEGGGPIFILSVSGTTTVQPSGHVYGAIAGCIEVYVQQGELPVITFPSDGFDEYSLNFLIGVQDLMYKIYSWEVSLL